MATIALAPQQTQNQQAQQMGTCIPMSPQEAASWYDYLQSNSFGMVFAIICTIILCIEIS